MSHPTIRTMTGATQTQVINSASTALLVIDFQKEYFNGKMPIPDGDAALANAKRLIAKADDCGMPVFHAQHVTPPGTPIFAEDGEMVAFHTDIQPAETTRSYGSLRSACFLPQTSTLNSKRKASTR